MNSDLLKHYKKNIPFFKGHANGNDFIFIFSKDIGRNLDIPAIVKEMCSRHTGAGADGLFIITLSKKYDFILDYYNSDGSWETLCANGSRCAVKLMNDLGLIKSSANFMAGDGPHIANILPNGNISMLMKTPKYKIRKATVEGFEGSFVDSGARHFVCESSNLEHDYIYKNGKNIRFSDFFSPKGVNVNFFKPSNDNSVQISTYEKGIENVVFSCASGSTAVVFHLYNENRVSSGIVSKSFGGNLAFYFDDEWKEPWVEGSAKIIFSGKFLLHSV